MTNDERQKVAREAASRLGPEMSQAMQIAALTSAIRALLATHPDKDAVRRHFDQLHAQLLANPAFLKQEDRKAVLQDMAETIFRDPVEP